MKRKNLLKTFLLTAAAGGIAMSAGAQVLFFDDFNSYADNAAFQAAWPSNAGTSGTTVLSTDPTGAANNTVLIQSARRSRDFDAFAPTNDTPLVFSFNLYDDLEAGSGYAIVGPASNFSFFALGAYHLVDGSDTSKYFLRHNGLGGPGWIQLDTDRVGGWNSMAIEFKETTYTVYINGVADTNATDLSWSLGTFAGLSRVQLGGGHGVGDSAIHIDNVQVEIIPEPSTYAAIFGGLALLGAFVYRRRLSAKK